MTIKILSAKQFTTKLKTLAPNSTRTIATHETDRITASVLRFATTSITNKNAKIIAPETIAIIAVEEVVCLSRNVQITIKARLSVILSSLIIPRR